MLPSIEDRGLTDRVTPNATECSNLLTNCFGVTSLSFFLILRGDVAICAVQLVIKFGKIR